MKITPITTRTYAHRSVNNLKRNETTPKGSENISFGKNTKTTLAAALSALILSLPGCAEKKVKNPEKIEETFVEAVGNFTLGQKPKIINPSIKYVTVDKNQKVDTFYLSKQPVTSEYNIMNGHAVIKNTYDLIDKRNNDTIPKAVTIQRDFLELLRNSPLNPDDFKDFAAKIESPTWSDNYTDFIKVTTDTVPTIWKDNTYIYKRINEENPYIFDTKVLKAKQI